MNLELPRNLVRASEGEGRAAESLRGWIVRLAPIVEDLARRWSLELGRPFQPGGVASWVAPALSATGERVVLKVGWRHDESLHEADGLKAWAGNGAVLLLDSIEIEDTNALLLEECEPGTPLSQVMPAAAQDAVVAGLLRRLWIEPAAGHRFRTLQGMCDSWAESFEARIMAGSPGSVGLDSGLAWAGIDLLRALPATAERCVLLCTDLHPGNVLAAGREPWLVIDPKPYLGDPTYDTVQHMLNHPDRLRSDPIGFAERMAGLLDLDAGRLREWLFARCVQESLDQPQLVRPAIALAP